VALLFRTIRLAGAAAAFAMLAPTVASAQYYGAPAPHYVQYRTGDDSRAGYSNERGSRDGYSRDRNYGDRRGHHPVRRDERRCDRGTGGTIIGAIAGGLLGNAAVGRHGNNAAGALAGAGVGALVGNSIDRDC
jgi:hypothetical protein